MKNDLADEARRHDAEMIADARKLVLAAREAGADVSRAKLTSRIVVLANHLEDNLAAFADALEEVGRLRAACKAAQQFIENGVEMGYIRLPAPPDSALNTLPMIRAALAAAPKESR